MKKINDEIKSKILTIRIKETVYNDLVSAALEDGVPTISSLIGGIIEGFLSWRKEERKNGNSLEESSK